jgi:hypothetical protein
MHPLSHDPLDQPNHVNVVGIIKDKEDKKWTRIKY